MKQILILLFLCVLFDGCVTPKNNEIPKQSGNYDYLFDKDLEPVNNDDEKIKLLQRMENKK